jgi:hypothetical protein
VKEKTTMQQFPNQIDTPASSQIAAIGHDPEEEILYVRFRKGFPGPTGEPKPADAEAHYEYQNATTEDFAALRGVALEDAHDPDAKPQDEKHSIGSHFGKTIKKDKERFPYTRVDDREKSEV